MKLKLISIKLVLNEEFKNWFIGGLMWSKVVLSALASIAKEYPPSNYLC